MARYENQNDDDDRPRRETLIERRLRASRGEQVEDEDIIADNADNDDDDDDDLPPRRYPPRYTVPVPMGGGCGQTLLYILLAVMTIVLVAMLLGQQFISNITNGLAQSVPDRVREVIATPTPTLRDRGGTILQIQAMNRLETLSFSVERVIEAGTQTGDWRDALLGDKLLLIASGDVVAGVDLSRIRASDLVISSDGKSITLKLPPSEIFSSRLNNDRTRVYNRDTKLGTRLTGGEDPTLETQARQAAEDEILKAACEANVMKRSADEAQHSMEQFLKLLDFDSVTVTSTPGQCVAPAGAAKTP